jgi:hypothetical protein
MYPVHLTNQKSGFLGRKVIVGKAKGVILSFDITDKYQPRFKRFFAPVD